MNKRNRILAAALGLVATAGAFDTVENFAILGNENGGARPIVLEPTDGAYKSPTGRKAFLVAADDYGETANKLPCTKNDLKALKERLEKLGFTTTVLQSDAGPSNAPTKAIIERRFKRFVESLESGDFAIVYLSGHGIQPTNSQEAFFVPVDFDEHDVFETSVSIDDMLVALKESKATFRWAIVDACRDDPTAEASAFKGASKSLGAKTLGGISAVPDSVALLQSCQPGKRSYEGGSLGAEDIENGFFTLSLLEALDENDSKADANEDGVLTFLEMSDYVSRRTNELARTRYGGEQVPNLNGSITNFALLDDLLIDGISKAEWNRADGLYQEACALRRQRRWRDALAKIGAARRINGKRKEYEDAEAEIQAQVDSVAASEKRAEADKLANGAWAAFDLGGEANVEKAIQLMKESLELVESVGNRRVLKTFEEELEAIRNPSVSPERPAPTASQDSQERPQSSEALETSGESSPTASSSEASGDWSGSYEAGTAKSLDIKGVKYTFRYCPAGTFTMGSSVSEKDRASDETQHKVTLTKDFWLLETEVTQAMWESATGKNPSAFSSGGRRADKVRGTDTSNFPADSVSWEDCREFVEKLNASGCAPEGWKFRLPTEAEWEYACRAGTTTPFFWGTALNGDKANCDGYWPYGTSTEGEFLGRTTEVGSYAPNAWGLRDMHGNVWEWCSDWKGVYNATSQTDPTGPSGGSNRVLRGGGWNCDAGNCRSAGRNYRVPTSRSLNFGVRIALGRALSEESSPASSQSSGASETNGESSSTASSFEASEDWSGSYAAGTAKSLDIEGMKYTFRYCPAGTFTMGSTESEELNSSSDETLRKVTLTKGFWLLETEVTQAMWRSATGENPTTFDGWKGPKKPVGNVSWEDCREFIKKLNASGCAPEGLVFRLPTEAEWEYACRAGTSGPYAGSSLGALGWYKNNSGGSNHDAGEKRANAWGLYDMHGNVEEWCSDWYGAYDASSRTDPTGPSGGSNRVLRGGCCSCGAEDCRAACRSYDDPARRFGFYGVRIALGREL